MRVVSMRSPLCNALPLLAAVILFCANAFAEPTATIATPAKSSKTDSTLEFLEFQLNDTFRSVTPEGWIKEQSPSWLAAKQDSGYGITLYGPRWGVVPTRIGLHYYASENPVYPSANDYIEKFSQPILGVSLSEDQYGPVTIADVAGRVALSFERLKYEYSADPDRVYPDNGDGKVYEQGEMMAVSFPARERFVVVPAKAQGFYSLRYSAPAEYFNELLPIFEHIVTSFQPLR